MFTVAHLVFQRDIFDNLCYFCKGISLIDFTSALTCIQEDLSNRSGSPSWLSDWSIKPEAPYVLRSVLLTDHGRRYFKPPEKPNPSSPSLVKNQFLWLMECF